MISGGGLAAAFFGFGFENVGTHTGSVRVARAGAGRTRVSGVRCGGGSITAGRGADATTQVNGSGFYLNRISEMHGEKRVARLVGDLDPVPEVEVPFEHFGAGNLARFGDGPLARGGGPGKLHALLVHRDDVVVEVEVIPPHRSPNASEGGRLRLLM